MHYAIIAAGEGSRLAQEGVPVPKPMVRLDDRPMLKRLIDIFAAYKAESISVIANAKMPEVCEYLEALAQEMPILRVVVASTPSSMHSLREVTRDIPSGKVIATTVDTIFHPEDFYRYAEAFDAVTDADAFMGVTDYIDDEKPLYVRTDDKLGITGFFDTDQGDRYISGGIYGLTKKAVDLLASCIESGMSRMRNYQRALVDNGLRVQAFPFGKIIDVDHASDIEKARKFLNISQ